MSWPSIATPSQIVEHTVKGQLKAPFEGGYVQSVAKYSRSRKQFELTWNAMSDSNKSSLLTAFGTDLGSTFTWTNPLDSASYTVRYRDDELLFTRDVAGKDWIVTVALEEQ